MKTFDFILNWEVWIKCFCSRQYFLLTFVCSYFILVGKNKQTQNKTQKTQSVLARLEWKILITYLQPPTCLCLSSILQNKWKDFQFSWTSEVFCRFYFILIWLVNQKVKFSCASLLLESKGQSILNKGSLRLQQSCKSSLTNSNIWWIDRIKYVHYSSVIDRVP